MSPEFLKGGPILEGEGGGVAGPGESIHHLKQRVRLARLRYAERQASCCWQERA